METFILQILDNWLALVGIVVAVAAAATAYIWFLGRMERQVAKAWLAVYEVFLERSDKIPLLVELVRDGAKQGAPDYESLLHELIAARSATAAKPLPTEEKRLAEVSLGEVLGRVLGEVSLQPALKKEALLLSLLNEFASWDSRLQLALIDYGRSLQTYRTFSLGSRPEGYLPFTY